MAEKKKKVKRRKKNNEANWMVSNSAQLDRRTKQHTQFESLQVTVPEIWAGQNRGGKKKKKRKKEKKEKRKKRKKKEKLTSTIPYSIPYGDR